MLIDNLIINYLRLRNPNNYFDYIKKLLGNEHITKLNSKILKCSKCKNCSKYKCLCFGHINSDILILGDFSFGDTDNSFPFNKKEITILKNILNKNNIKNNSIFLMNTVSCSLNSCNSIVPKEEMINNCYTYIEEAIKIIEPKIIIALGVTALNGLIKNDKKNDLLFLNKPKNEIMNISKYHGKWFDVKGVPTIATYSIKYLLELIEKNKRNKICSIKYDILNDFNTAFKYYKNIRED